MNGIQSRISSQQRSVVMTRIRLINKRGAHGDAWSYQEVMTGSEATRKAWRHAVAGAGALERERCSKQYFS